MTLIIPPGFAQATIPFNHDLLNREAVITFGVDSSNYPGNYVVLANAILGKWGDRWGTLVDADVLMGPVELAVGQDGGENLIVVGSTTEQATNVAASVTPNVALLLQKRSARGGRRGRGRMFVPWVIEEGDVNEAGIIDGPDVDTFTLQAELFRTDLVGQGSEMVLLHNTGNSAPGSPDTVTSLTADNLVSTQRRRLGR